jgi:hypothetical protein
VLNCTWDEVEAESVLRELELPVEKQQQRLYSYYLKLREEYRNSRISPNSASATNKP